MSRPAVTLGVLVVAVLAAGVAFSAPAAAAEPVDGCAVIDESGAYELAENVSSEGTCVEITADDVTFDGQGHSVTAAADHEFGAPGIRVADAENVTITDTTVRGWEGGLAAGIEFENTSGGEVASVTATGNGDGIAVTDSADITLRRSTVRESQFRGIAVQGSSAITVTNTTVRAVGSTGVRLSGGSDHEITDNDVAGSGLRGIGLVSVDGSIVTDNAVRDSDRGGIDLLAGGAGSSDNNTIAGNVVRGSGDRGIYLFNGAADNAVRDNVVTGTAGVGIVLEGSVDNTLTDNVVRGSGDAALRAEDATGDAVERLEVGAGDSAAVLSFEPDDVAVVAVDDPPAPPGDRVEIGRYFRAEARGDRAELRGLELAYADADAAGVEEGSLSLWRHDGSEWVEIDETGVDPDRNVVTATITDFSTIGAFGREAATTLQVDSIDDAFPDGIAGDDYGAVEVDVGVTGKAPEDLVVTLEIEGEAAGVVFAETVVVDDLDGGTATVTFDIGRIDATGNYTAAVTADADGADPTTAATRFRVDAPPEPLLTGLDIAGQGSDASVVEGNEGTVAVNVTNAGDRTGSFDVALKLGRDDGSSVRATRSISDLAAGETATVRFEGVVSGLDADDYDVTVSAGDDTVTGDLRVNEPAFFAVEISETTPPDDVVGGEVEVAFAVENTGDVTGEQAIVFEVGGEEVGAETVALGGGADHAGTFTYTTEPGDAPVVNVTVASDDDIDSTAVRIVPGRSDDEGSNGNGDGEKDGNGNGDDRGKENGNGNGNGQGTADENGNGNGNEPGEGNGNS